MKSRRGVLAIFDDDRKAAPAVRKLREAGHAKLTVYSPVPSHALDAALGAPGSAVSLFTLGGALLGVVVGFGLSAYAGMKWNLITSGKPVLAWIPFVVVAFELAILLGALGNFLSMILLSGLGRFGIFVPCREDAAGEVRDLLDAFEAVDVKDIRDPGAPGNDRME
jgi:molybdopterin-containing oxidoreductase family membrane subunit